MLVRNKATQPRDEALKSVAHVHRRVAQRARRFHNAIREIGARLVRAAKSLKEGDEAVVFLKPAKARRRRIRRPTLGGARDGWTKTPPLLHATPFEKSREKRGPMIVDRGGRDPIGRAGRSMLAVVVLNVGVDVVVGERILR